MTWKEALKEFIGNIAKNGLININISVLENLSKIQVIKNSVVDSNIVAFNADERALTLNIGKMSSETLEALSPILRAAFDESGCILREDTRKHIEDFRQAESLAGPQNALHYFKPLIPSDDLPILRSSLYLRECHTAGNNIEVTRIKGAIIETYGVRGRNIANLCTAGYFESWFTPLYQTLLDECGDEVAAKSAFLKIYNNVVIESPWTVFVSRHHAQTDIKEEITGKLEKNLGYGLKWLNVHGLGKDNMKTIKAICEEIEQSHLASVVEAKQERNRIYVRLECTQSPLPPTDASA